MVEIGGRPGRTKARPYNSLGQKYDPQFAGAGGYKLPATELGSLVDGRVGDAGLEEGFATLGAGAALAAVFFATFVAGICEGIVYTEFGAASADVGLSDIGVGGYYVDTVVCSLGHSARQGVDESASAVGINGVVAAVVGYHDMFQAMGFGQSEGYGENDTVAEGDDGRAHILIVIVTLGDIVGSG